MTSPTVQLGLDWTRPYPPSSRYAVFKSNFQEVGNRQQRCGPRTRAARSPRTWSNNPLARCNTLVGGRPYHSFPRSTKNLERPSIFAFSSCQLTSKSPLLSTSSLSGMTPLQGKYAPKSGSSSPTPPPPSPPLSPIPCVLFGAWYGGVKTSVWIWRLTSLAASFDLQLQGNPGPAGEGIRP
ncbi:hypothetical protein BDP55DRAFT_631180 [Colletotrichum godetiae]|uniref:Uncharacterized protein n=1 Tax=Colletotrichum godetiae TaxID=1209918 RepID=A0AAJ0AMD3_9PEZI|nr:uncharacterized protein BDP55DRAFT_631180 [Colletotrichum godetiae]KAK1676549.1 hypothetical protein BDP55DRAFT_631180 [Colletotrichum godetiae]